MSYKVKILIKYDGTEFEGWQRQAGNTPTIQAALEAAASRMLSEPITVVGSGRTDSGVHAMGQVAHFITQKDPTDKVYIAKGLNSLLPASVSVQKAWLAPDDFHAQRSAVRKTYIYRIQNTPWPDPMLRRYSLWLRRPIDMQKLNAASEFLVGEHDFKSFQTGGTELKTTIRRVISAGWTKSADGILQFEITGTGFLKQMVRNIVGALLHVEQYESDPAAIQKIMLANDRQAAKGTAPAQGLFLLQVDYPQDLDNRCREL